MRLRWLCGNTVRFFFPLSDLSQPEAREEVGRVTNNVADELLERNHRALKYEAPQRLNLASLQNWTEATGSLARAEIAYLDNADDLICLATQTDEILVRVELFLERVVIWATELFGMVGQLGWRSAPLPYY